MAARYLPLNETTKSLAGLVVQFNALLLSETTKADNLRQKQNVDIVC